MRRLFFRMRLHPGQEAEYRRRHDALWPELADLLRGAGVSDYSIHLDRESGLLFATLLCADEAALAALPTHPVMRRWWAHMADIMQTHPDGAPVSVPLEEMFHLP